MKIAELWIKGMSCGENKQNINGVSVRQTQSMKKKEISEDGKKTVAFDTEYSQSTLLNTTKKKLKENHPAIL